MIVHVVALDDCLAFPDRPYASESVAEEGVVQAQQSLQWRLRDPQAQSLVPRRGRSHYPGRHRSTRLSRCRHRPGPIGPHQYFFGEVNGQTGHATIKMGCFGPIYRGQHGHPSPARRSRYLPAPTPTISDRGLGLTGSAAHASDVRFPTPTVAKVPVIVRDYAVTAPIPVSLILPCAGRGKVAFDQPNSTHGDSDRLLRRSALASVQMPGSVVTCLADLGLPASRSISTRRQPGLLRSGRPVACETLASVGWHELT
jgi:hypothetical protein